MEIQNRIFDDLKKLVQGKFVEELSEVLCISTDAAYRRIRNEKLLTIEEVVRLCQHYQLSFDRYVGLENKQKTVPFIFPFPSLEFNFKSYLMSILDNMKKVQAMDGEVFFSAKDIPMFHCFQLPGLTKFKLFYWQKTMLGRTDFAGVKYSDYEPEKSTVNLCYEIYETYSNVRSTEIWNYETVHGLISQINYYHTIGYATAEETSALFEELKILINHLLIEAEIESKSIIGKRDLTRKNNFRLFYNEVLAADNSIYAEMGQQQVAFMPHIILNFIITADKDYCDYIKEVFGLVMRKSTLVSGVNERDRSLFFNYIFDRIAALELKKV